MSDNGMNESRSGPAQMHEGDANCDSGSSPPRKLLWHYTTVPALARILADGVIYREDESPMVPISDGTRVKWIPRAHLCRFLQAHEYAAYQAAQALLPTSLRGV